MQMLKHMLMNIGGLQSTVHLGVAPQNSLHRGCVEAREAGEAGGRQPRCGAGEAGRSNRNVVISGDDNEE